MKRIAWVASITVSVFDENGDDYTGDDPIKAARLAFANILELTEPMVAVECRATDDEAFFAEPEVLQQLVVDLEIDEVIEA